MVFQSYALYPHLTVYDNIAFGLRLRKTPKEEIDKRVREAAHVLGLEDFLDRKPRALSGRPAPAGGDGPGDRPRAAGVPDGRATLEPGREASRPHARGDREPSDELGVTTIYVTHDQVEAMTMGDRVAVMRKGEIQQVAPPQELYERPVNLFVGGFIGSPAMNLVEAQRRAPQRSPRGAARRARRSPWATTSSPPARRSRRTSTARSSSASDRRTSRTPRSSRTRPRTSACAESSCCASRSARRSSRTSPSPRRPR